MIVWNKLTIQTVNSAATLSIDNAGSLSISSNIITPAINTGRINVDNITVNNNATFSTATFTGNVSAAALTVDNITIDSGKINITNSCGNNASLSAGTLSISAIQDVSTLGVSTKPVALAYINEIGRAGSKVSSFYADAANINTLTVNTAATLPTNTTVGGEPAIPGIYLTKNWVGIDMVEIKNGPTQIVKQFLSIYNNAKEVLYITNQLDTDPDHYVSMQGELLNQSKFKLEPEQWAYVTYDQSAYFITNLYYAWDAPFIMSSLNHEQLVQEGANYINETPPSSITNLQSSELILFGKNEKYDCFFVKNNPTTSDTTFINTWKGTLESSQGYTSIEAASLIPGLYLGTKN